MTDTKLKAVSFMVVVLILLMICQIRISHAHDVAGPIDPTGDVPSFTAVALVTCFDDGNGPADYLMANIKDHPANPPVEGMFVNLTLFKGDQAISTTDIVPGDDSPSESVSLRGGAGSYHMIASKTRAGVRDIVVDYHCMTANHTHTGTDIALLYYPVQ